MAVEQKTQEPASPSTSEKLTKPKRTLIKQTEVPSVSLEQALRVPRAIAENYGARPTKPLHVATGMGIQASTGGFRQLTGAAIAYGLTSGGYKAQEIGIEPLGMRIVRPTVEGDDLAAKREAFLRPHWGTGFWVRACSEPLLIATKGAARPPANPHLGLLSHRFEHSRKPDSVYELAEGFGGPFVELFARGVPRPGWTAWGAEVATPAEAAAD